MAFDKTQDAYLRLRGIVTERTRPVMIWCGAGLSVPAGIPDWSRLRQTLTAALRRKASGLDREAGMTTTAAADAIEKEPGPWVAFERLEAALGRTTFIDVIREALRPASSAAIPPTYPLLWQLRPAGVLNLNLDKLATRAYYEVNGSRHLTEFNSKNVGPNTIALQGLHPFVYNLHGTHEDSNSWVLTHDRLQMLRRDQGYKNFIAGVLSTHVVVFLGLSAEDVAVGGHLERLAVAGIDTGPHYWLSSRADLATDKWAEANGIRLIPYRTTDGSHTELT